MPRNGSGQYNPLTNTWNPPVTGVLATSADFQAQLNDISAAITQSVSKDGQTPMTANLPMGNNSIVGIASGTETSPSISANGDTNTGLYFPAADTVGVAVGGVNVGNFTSAGFSGPTYETSNTAAGLTISNNDIVADGTDANINIDITPKGTGDVLVGSQAVNVADNQILVSNTELLQIVTKACPTGAVTNLFSFDIPGPSAGAPPYSKGMFRVHVAVNGDVSHESGGFQEVLIPYLAGDSFAGATANVVVNCSANFGVSKTITVTVSSRTVTVALDMAAYAPNHNKTVTCYIYNKDKTRTVTPL